MKSSIMVAGAAGLIGSNLSRTLLEQGHKVLGVDNLLTGLAQNIKTLEKHPNFSFLKHDITQAFQVDTQIEQIYHLASPASPDDFETKALEILWANSLGTKHLLDLANSHKARFLFSSTSEVYGDPHIHPQTEDYWGHVNPNGPRSCYDESKRFAESLIFNYCHKYQVKFSIARIFNTYGPGMRLKDGRVVSNFILQALNNEALLLHDGGQQTRSFCFVDDLVQGLIGLMNSDNTLGDVFNLGNPNEFTIETLATSICEIAGKSTRLKSIPSPRADDPKKRCPDISKIKSAIGWEPQVPLKEGLQKTYEDFKERL